MSTPATKPMPLILDNAGITIDGSELACVANHVELSPDTSTTTIDTFCGSTDYPGVTKWTLNATLYQSFDAGATEEVLSAAVEGGAPVAFTLVGYRDKPVGPTNPEWSGMLVPQPYAPINGDAGGESTVDLAWALTDAPVKSVTPAAGTSTQSEKKAA